MADSVGVAIRVRPYLPGEDETPNQGTTADVSDPKVAEVRVRIKSKKIDLRSTFGKVFPTSATQQDVFDYCEAAVDGSLRGINATVFAYGQTNSGKTHTMLGSLEDIGPSTGKRSTNGADATANDGLDGDDPMGESNVHSVVGDNAGLIPRAAHRLFQLAAADEELNLTVTCSFLQIYNNQVFDLLRDKSMRRPLRIRERRKQGIFINGLSQVQVSCAADIVSLLKSGGARRAVRGTEYNEQSSRSHAILQLAIESQREKQDPSDEDKTRRVIHRAKLNLVDLAGSEKWNTSVRMGAAQQKELTHINSSLSALGNVISALSDDKRSHVPYRDSALTRILQDALGGNSRTVLIATVAPTLHCAEESISTLKFADRASHVKLKIRVNELLDDATLLARAKREIVRLKRLLKKKSTKQMKQIEDDLKLFREMNDRLRAENAQLRQQLRTFGVHFPGTPKNGSAAAKNAGGGNMIYASPRSASADPSARDMHPLEQVRPFTTGTLPKLATSPGKVKLSPNARPSKTNTSAWATNSNDSTDERYATLEARIRAMEEAFQHGRSIEDSEAPRTDTHAAVVAAVEALDDNELTARLAAVDEDEAMSLIQQEEEYKCISSERAELEQQLAALQAMLSADGMDSHMDLNTTDNDSSIPGSSTRNNSERGSNNRQHSQVSTAQSHVASPQSRAHQNSSKSSPQAKNESENERLLNRKAKSTVSAKKRLEQIVAGLSKAAEKKSPRRSSDEPNSHDQSVGTQALAYSVDDIGIELKVYRARFATHYVGKIIDFDPRDGGMHRIHFKKSGEKPWYNMKQHQFQIVASRPPISLLSKKLQAAIAAGKSPKKVTSSLLVGTSKSAQRWHQSKVKIYGGATPSSSKAHGNKQKVKGASRGHQAQSDKHATSAAAENVDDDYAALFMQ